MKLIFFPRVPTHAAAVDYFLGKWSTDAKKPYCDKKGVRGEEDRLVSPQPHVFKEATIDNAALFNLRKMSELPYHLILAGDVGRLKEEVLCNFDWLYQKMRAKGFDR